MRKLLAVIAIAAASACLAQDGEGTQPRLERSKQQAQTDARAILELHKKYADSFRGVTGEVTVHETSPEGTLKLCAEWLPKLEALEQTALPELKPVLARVTELWTKPGAEEAARQEKEFDEAQFAFQQSGDIEWNMKMAAADNDVRAARDLPAEFDGLSTRYSDLVRMANDVAKTRAANAAYLADSVKAQPVITFFVQDKRVGIMKEWKTTLGWALKFDRSNAYANARLATIDAEIADLEKALEKEIDERQWVGHAGDFPGPGTAADLARASAEFLRKDKGWGNQGPEPAKNDDGSVRKGVEVVAVSVRGPWQVAETDVFGRILSWRLPIHLAVTKPDLRAKNVARVYELSIVTVQGAPNRAAKAPPFDGCWVGDSWMMRLNKVQQAP